MTDSDIDKLFDQFLDEPKLASWSSDLSAPEYQAALILFRYYVRLAINLSQTK